MGLDRTIQLGSTTPSWDTIRGRLEFAVKIQMIDDQLAFPDETPSDSWTEIRIGTPSGMVTLRRAGAEIMLIVWGNASSELIAERDVLANAFLQATKS